MPSARQRLWQWIVVETFGGDLFVVDDFFYGSSLPSPGNRDIGSDRLKRLKSDGTLSDFDNFGGANGLAWGVGSFGSDLWVSDSYARRVYRVNSSGTTTEFAKDRAFNGLAFSAGGAFNNALYVGEYKRPGRFKDPAGWHHEYSGHKYCLPDELGL